MLPNKLSLRKINDAWRKFFKETNAAQPLVQRKRTRPDGSIKTYYERKKALSDGVLTTGLELIKFYVTAYEQAMRMGFTSEAGSLPTLFSNGPWLGKRCGVSDRTMRSRLSRMEQYGFIKKIFHGTHHDYELWITPKFLFQDAEAVFSEAQNSTVSDAQRNDLPLNVAFETTGNIEKENSDVDKLGVALQQGAMPDGDGKAGNTCDTFTGDTGLQPGRIPAEEAPDSPLTATEQATEAGGAAPARKPALSPAFKSYVEIFWQYAMRSLYPGYAFEEEQHKMAKNAIWYGVYGGFKADLTEEEWELYHDQALQRLDLAATYYRNHQDKYPPMPYAEFVHGSGYFDWQNSRGFRATEEWLVKQQVWKHQQRVEDALRRARHDFRLHKKGKAAKRLQEKSPLQLFKFHENRIKRLGAAALDKFYKQHTNL